MREGSIIQPLNYQAQAMSNIGFQERIVTNAKFITFTWITLSKPTKLKKTTGLLFITL